ncbi:hypothetical protein BX592_113114 [Paraburkholderia rhizosphaerae]|uniref:Uncharacterized protein n=1 Tax=Paraburkholderia rhizosphaerae TaxID=480658 RepID=A0A4R8LMA6_9BURK|nr:hypothetical protein BX592_113114 [Paraburkholderia rhizosphaerae]
MSPRFNSLLVITYWWVFWWVGPDHGLKTHAGIESLADTPSARHCEPILAFACRESLTYPRAMRAAPIIPPSALFIGRQSTKAARQTGRQLLRRTRTLHTANGRQQAAYVAKTVRAYLLFYESMRYTH